MTAQKRMTVAQWSLQKRQHKELEYRRQNDIFTGWCKRKRLVVGRISNLETLISVLVGHLASHIGQVLFAFSGMGMYSLAN